MQFRQGLLPIGEAGAGEMLFQCFGVGDVLGELDGLSVLVIELAPGYGDAQRLIGAVRGVLVLNVLGTGALLLDILLALGILDKGGAGAAAQRLHLLKRAHVFRLGEAVAVLLEEVRQCAGLVLGQTPLPGRGLPRPAQRRDGLAKVRVLGNGDGELLGADGRLVQADDVGVLGGEVRRRRGGRGRRSGRSRRRGSCPRFAGGSQDLDLEVGGAAGSDQTQKVGCFFGSDPAHSS